MSSVVLFFKVQITRIFCRVWSEQSASYLSGFSVRMFCFVQEKPLCKYVCVDVMVM